MTGLANATQGIADYLQAKSQRNQVLESIFCGTKLNNSFKNNWFYILLLSTDSFEISCFPKAFRDALVKGKRVH